MLNKERIRQMTALARYEQEDGKKELKISRYYRNDYIGLMLLKNFFLTTIGYFLVIGLWAMWKIDWLMDGMDSMNLWVLLILLAAVYVGMLVVYSLLTVAFSLKKYKKAVRDTKKYTQRLGVLLREYDREKKGVSAGKKSHIAGADRKNKRR